MAPSGTLHHRQLHVLGPEWSTHVTDLPTGWLEIQRLPVAAVVSGRPELQPAA